MAGSARMVAAMHVWTQVESRIPVTYLRPRVATPAPRVMLCFVNAMAMPATRPATQRRPRIPPGPLGRTYRLVDRKREWLGRRGDPSAKFALRVGTGQNGPHALRLLLSRANQPASGA